MATRTIVTSQPDVACDVCARRLLRGEQPDVFVGAGRRRIVCELCAPRAAHEGWMRETDAQSLTLPPMRARRGRSLFERLSFKARPSEGGGQSRRPPGEARGGLAADSAGEQEVQPYDLLADSAHPEAHVPHGAGEQPGEAAPSHPAAPASETPAPLAQPASHGESQYVRQAIAVFNASEFPRRVAGVARSLGAPAVTVRSAEHLDSVVSIVVAWELCWYRYEVDLSEPVVEAQAIAQGTELAELAREDRLANAAAAESGALLLPAA
jgi:hypothetical protein